MSRDNISSSSSSSESKDSKSPEASSFPVPSDMGEAKKQVEQVTQELSVLYAKRDDYFEILTKARGSHHSGIEANYDETLGKIDELERHLKIISIFFPAIFLRPSVPSVSPDSGGRAGPHSPLSLLAGSVSSAGVSVSIRSSQKAPEIEQKSAQPAAPIEPIMITLYNDKGGVGKTTATYNLGYQLSQMGFKVLMIDGDPQSSLSAQINPDHSSEDRSKVLRFREQLRKQREEKQLYTEIDYIFAPSIHAASRDIAATPTARAHSTKPLQVYDYPNLFYIPGSIRFGKLEKLITLGLGSVPGSGQYATMVPEVFREIGRFHGFDIILVDLNPGIGGLNQSVIMCSDYLLIPFKPSIGCLDAVTNLIEILPEWFREMRSLGLLSDKQGPRFLGTFPQLMRVKKYPDSEEKFIESGYKGWIQQIFKMSENLLAVFKTQMGDEQPNVPSDTYKNQVGIIDMVGAGLHSQRSGRPMSDLEYTHTSIDAAGREKQFSWRENQKKKQVANGYKKVIATHLQCLTPHHKTLLLTRVPTFTETLMLWSCIDYGIAAEKRSPAPPEQKSKGLDTRWYTHDDLNRLFEHYLRDNKDDQDNYYTTPMQGDGAFSREALSQNLTNYLLENIAADAKRAESATIFIPFNTGAGTSTDGSKGGSHWTLGIIRYGQQRGLKEIFYFDPLGRRHMERSIPDSIAHALKTTVHEVFGTEIDDIMSLQLPVQTDGHNCGPWIVEMARTIVNDLEARELFNLNIEDARRGHALVLQSAEPGVTRSRKAPSRLEGSSKKKPKTTPLSQRLGSVAVRALGPEQKTPAAPSPVASVSGAAASAPAASPAAPSPLVQLSLTTSGGRGRRSAPRRSAASSTPPELR